MALLTDKHDLPRQIPAIAIAVDASNVRVQEASRLLEGPVFVLLALSPQRLPRRYGTGM